jgi:DNA-binding phage protein
VVQAGRPRAEIIELPVYRTSDPRISTVLAVAKTLGVKIGDLVN